MSDILVVSLGTTQGLRVADSLLVSMLREAGAETDAIRVRIGATNALRRGYPLNDLVEAVAARRALAGARRRGPQLRAVVFSTTTAAMLADTAGLPYAVRLDSPAILNRPGARNAPVLALEQRSLGRARLILALGAAGAAALPVGSARAEVVPVPVDLYGEGRAGATAEHDPDLAVAYVPDPRTKGLLRLCQAWPSIGERHLDVFGIDTAAARAWLDRHGVTVPAGITFHGYVSAPVFRATVRRCRCYISAASWEDYGQAPLEALADGALLVTAPADGAYEALALARALDPDLVAGDLEPGSLARAIEAAFARDDAACAGYRARAAELLEPYGWGPAVETLRSRVLPALLGLAGDEPR
jgi:hypothetical protein